MVRKLLCAAALAAAWPSAQAQLNPRSAGANAFNPGISLILQGAAASSSQDPDAYRIDGFAPSGGEVGPAPRGFSLGESEIGMAANIDPYFRGQLVASFTPENEVEVEEAFFQTLGLGQGFTLKGGRFLSGIGYQNSIHQHAWDFRTPRCRTRRSWAGSSGTTACSSSGLRRRTSWSRWAPSFPRATSSRAATATRTA